MAREVSFGRAEVVVVPEWVVDLAEREFDAGRAKILVVYPNDATADQVIRLTEMCVEARRTMNGEG